MWSKIGGTSHFHFPEHDSQRISILWAMRNPNLTESSRLDLEANVGCVKIGTNGFWVWFVGLSGQILSYTSVDRELWWTLLWLFTASWDPSPHIRRVPQSPCHTSGLSNIRTVAYQWMVVVVVVYYNYNIKCLSFQSVLTSLLWLTGVFALL